MYIYIYYYSYVRIYIYIYITTKNIYIYITILTYVVNVCSKECVCKKEYQRTGKPGGCSLL